MFLPSPSPSHSALPSSSSSSSSSSSTSSRSCSSSTPTPTPAPSTPACYYTSFRTPSATSKSGSHFAPAPRAPSKEFVPLPSVAEYRSGLSTPTASPVPSSRRTTSSGISPANIKFNPILTSPSSSLRFNFLNPNANTCSHDPAFPSGQVSSYIPILCGPLNLLIYINPSTQMSCSDFLLAISNALAQPVNPYTDDEWLQVGPQNQHAITTAYQKRVSKYPDPYLRKVDFLLDQTHFRGLRFAYNAWALIVD